jgi:hypothetical protein
MCSLVVAVQPVSAQCDRIAHFALSGSDRGEGALR